LPFQVASHAPVLKITSGKLVPNARCITRVRGFSADPDNAEVLLEVAPKESAPEKSLAQSAASGILVTMTGQILRIAVQVLSVVILARLLSPTDYGLLAMVAAVIGVADIFRDFGLSTAAIQAKSLSRDQRTNLFWINTGIGIVLAGAVFALAPVIASVYGQPALVEIAQVLSITFVLNGVATQYRADLNRKLAFSTLAAADVVSPIIALAGAVWLAAGGAGLWALVGQQLIQYTVMLVMVVWGAKWLPGLPRRSVPMDGMLRFGWNIVVTQLINYVSNNADYFIIGLRSGAVALGNYSRAFQLLMNPLNQVRSPVTRVAIPVLSRLQDDDDQYGAFLLRGQLALGHSLGFVLGIAAGAAAPITVLFLGGDEWSGVAPLLALLAVAGVFQMLAFVGYWVYVTRGLTKRLLQDTIFSSSVRLLLIIVGSQWGVVGVAAGYALGPALTWPATFWWLSRFTTIPIRGLYLGALRIVFLSAVSVVAAWSATTLLEDTLAVVAILVAVAAAGLTCAMVCLVLPPFRRDALAILDVARRMSRRPARGA
jgi:O-antigen/teichoic acid export membrane protein